MSRRFLACVLWSWTVLGLALQSPLYAAPGSQPTTRPAGPQPAPRATPRPTARRKTPPATAPTSINCGLTAQQKKAPRRLLALGRVADIPGMLAALSWATHKGWFPQLDVLKLQRAKQFLQGKMIKWLGVEWSQGIWVTIYDKTPTKKALPTPFSWMPTHVKGIRWPLATQALERLDITIGVAIRKSYWLGFALRQLLGLTGQSHYQARIDGYKSYWLYLQRGAAAVIVVTPSQLLVRLLWRDTDIASDAGRRRRWQHEVKSLIDDQQSTSFFQQKQRLTSTFPSQANGIAYIRPRALCHWLKPLPFPTKEHILRSLARIDGFGLGAQASSTAIRLDQKLWSPTTPPLASKPKGPLPKPHSIARWAPATAHWLQTLDVRRYPVHQLFSLFSPPDPKSFYNRLGAALQAVVRQKGLEPAGVGLWQGTWRQWWLESTMMQRLIVWMETPAITHDGQRKAHGYVATGVWPAGAKGLITAALPRVQGITRIGAFGQQPIFVSKQPNGTAIAFAWRKQRWFMTSHIGILRRVIQQYEAKTKGTKLKFAPNGSLLHLQSWNQGWNVIHINPARMACRWHPLLPDKWAKQVAKHVQLIEFAALDTATQRSASIRIGWKQGGLLPPKEPYGLCWDRAEWWRRLGALGLALPLRSPFVQLFRPMIQPHLPRLRAALDKYKRLLAQRAKQKK